MNSTYAPELTQWQNPTSAVSELEAPEICTATPWSTPESLQQESQQDEDPWAVWPYVWVIDFHAFCRLRFHSFHGRFDKWCMQRHNHRRQKQFWARHGFRPSDEEMGLELL